MSNRSGANLYAAMGSRRTARRPGVQLRLPSAQRPRPAAGNGSGARLRRQRSVDRPPAFHRATGVSRSGCKPRLAPLPVRAARRSDRSFPVADTLAVDAGITQSLLLTVSNRTIKSMTLDLAFDNSAAVKALVIAAGATRHVRRRSSATGQDQTAWRSQLRQVRPARPHTPGRRKPNGSP